MYDILNVAYGFTYTEQVRDALAALEGVPPGEFDFDTLEPQGSEKGEIGWFGFYTGHVLDLEPPAFFGALLDDMPSWETTPERCSPTPSEELVLKVWMAFEELPHEIQEVVRAAGDPVLKVIHVWSTS